ncbi:procollagen-lysine,2-oxoglutarate 5-dioxygenase 1-like [Penaeus chinensis]|uniref:procollagen-lysine,2-oxoglutarate 5-dioxygenase 1-like n=1 Tax=Penaeus chinensis TaxID=139456 RepID=UPI001FB6BB14|nr:procollagen-lysine,2-oxoglutarate 5-dioxygenase 1-like [Penaeus chinensis]
MFLSVLTASLAVIGCLVTQTTCAEDRDLLIVTVATNETDGFKRFIRSLNINGLQVKVLGLGLAWEGGDVKNVAGGGHKVNLLKEELKKYKDDAKKIIMFSDSYDVIFTDGKNAILERFDKLNAQVVFAAEDYCWPNKNLASQYPRVPFGYKYLNSGGFIGYAPDVYKVVTAHEIKNEDDDQLYYTEIFLDEKLRKLYGMKLDTQAKIFQNLNGQYGDVSMKFDEDDTVIVNTVYQSSPVVIHGNGPSKILLNSLGNYLAKSWVYNHECLACKENTKDIKELERSEYPVVLVAVFVEKPMPFLEEMLEKVANLDYPKNRIDLFVHNQEKLHVQLVDEWMSRQKSAGYRSTKFISEADNIKEWHARNLAVEHCLKKDCDAYFSVDADIHLDNPETLTHLLSQNRPILGAVMVRAGQAWSTFWGALNEDGFYARSIDYMDIVNNNRRGIWNVPYLTGVYVIQRSVLASPETRPNYIYKLLDADMAMAANMREKGIFMYVSNLEDYGHLIEPNYFPTKYMHNDMWQMKANKEDWENRYISPLFWKALDLTTLNEMPCPDVYWFPIFTPRFCKELVELANDNGGWSDGTNNDPRLAGGYENVPTVDIHMNQMEYEQEWLWILRHYVKPLAEKVYLGYDSGARSIMNFIVRYRPEEQSLLRPHHDSSTYTINVGLNRPHIDYEGGGARFIRYNCSVINTRVGWGLMHPGRLTHYHEGLRTTSGTRYIMVSFIDP